MYRDQLAYLQAWRNHALRKPLVIRGARQVGKSWLVEKFAQSFEHYIVIDFDKQRRAHQIFAGDLDIQSIVRDINVLTGRTIIPERTLLFFDEIQECPAAINALRYFKEEYPALHVIAAGSLIDFILHKIGMPVGRVQFMHLYPLSFGEFLLANGRGDLREVILTQKVSPIAHTTILDYLKVYLWLGGMPAAVDAWLKTKDPTACQDIQDEMITAYQQDFYKYGKEHQMLLLNTTFDSIPNQLGRKFKYVNVSREHRSVEIKDVLTLLNKAGIIHYCYHTSAQGLPLGAGKDIKKFKIFFFDLGLAQRLLGLDVKFWLSTSINLSNQGAMAEQFVAQEILAYSANQKAGALYYWHREAKSSNAEVDFVMNKHQHIIPIEVKSGTGGRLRSLQIFLDSHPQTNYGVSVANQTFAQQDKLLTIPLYGIEALITNEAPISLASEDL